MYCFVIFALKTTCNYPLVQLMDRGGLNPCGQWAQMIPPSHLIVKGMVIVACQDTCNCQKHWKKINDIVNRDIVNEFDNRVA